MTAKPDTDDWTGIDHVQLAMPPGAEAACRAFYVDVLGLAEVERPAGASGRSGFWVRGSGVELHLAVEQEFSPARLAHPALLTKDLDKVAGALAAAGHAVDWDDRNPGVRRFFTYDAVGNRIEIIG